MKKIIISIVVLSSISIYSQSAIMRMLDSDPRISVTLRSNNVYDPNKNNNTIEGNPYSSSDFLIGTIPNINASITFKYNAHKDVIEFKDGNSIYELPKDINYSPISLSDGTKVVLETNNDGNLSYYTQLFEKDNVALLKRNRVTLSEAKPTDGYREATAPKFSSLKTEYFLKSEDKIIEFPKNKKELLAKYSNNPTLEQFIKKNGSYIKDENAMKEIVKLISQK